VTEIHRLDQSIEAYDRHMARQDHPAQQLMRLCGIGQTAATALVAMVGNGHDFKSGRQLSAWIGLVPGQYSSGGKTRLGKITKSADAYLRSLLIMGARAVLNAAKNKTDSVSRWAVALEQRAGYWKAVVATRGEEREDGLGNAQARREVHDAWLSKRRPPDRC
jgi:transposase